MPRVGYYGSDVCFVHGLSSGCICFEFVALSEPLSKHRSLNQVFHVSYRYWSSDDPPGFPNEAILLRRIIYG